MTPETHKYAAAVGSFCFVITENGEQQDVCNLTTMPSVQRSLCLDGAAIDSGSIQSEAPEGVDSQTRDMLERCITTCGKAAGSTAKRRSRARKEASAQKAQHFEYKSFDDNEVFDLVDFGKVNRRTMGQDDGCSPSRLISRATFSRQRPDGY